MQFSRLVARNHARHLTVLTSTILLAASLCCVNGTVLVQLPGGGTGRIPASGAPSTSGINAVRVAAREGKDAVRADSITPTPACSALGGGSGPPHPVLINVGLVHTGTRWFAALSRHLGLSTVHVGPCNVPYDLDNSTNSLAVRFAQHQSFSDIPFNGRGFIERAVEFSRCHPLKVQIVATVRERDEWVDAMLKYSRDGGCFIRIAYGIDCTDTGVKPTREQVEHMYTQHVELLRKHAIPMVNAGNVSSVCTHVGIFPAEVQEQCLVPFEEGDVTGKVRSASSGPCNDSGIGSGY